MDGVIVAVVHDEFRGMEAVVVDVCSMQGAEGMNIARVADGVGSIDRGCECKRTVFKT